jgi:hypothetical protein
MLPEHFYMTGLGKIAYVALYLPLVLGLLWLLLWKLRSVWPLWIILAIVLLTMPFWDVYLIGRDADRLCREQSGLHVYKTVEADSFRGGGDIVKLSDYGFKYAESYGLGGKKYHYTAQGGKWFEQEIDEFKTRYEIAGRGYQVITNSIASNALRTVDLETGEVLGELVTLNIFPGRFDGFFLKLVSSGPVVWHCGEEPPSGRKDPLGFNDLILATLKPKQRE